MSPLLGYNNNVRHKNRVFHIQTEDSGIKHPHIITHIFMDGGRILKSVKTSYAEHIGDEKMSDVVRQMMKDQHKAMFRALRDGELDAVVDDALAAAANRKSDAALARTQRPPEPPPSTEDVAPKTQRDEVPTAPLTLDLDVLQEAPPSFQPQGDLPPPPPNVLTARGGDPGTGRYRTLEDREERAPRKSERPPRTDRTPASARGEAKKSERPPPSVRGEAKKSERPPPAKKSDRPRAAREERVKRAADPRAEPPSEPKQPVATQSSRPDRQRDAKEKEQKAGRGPAPAAVRPAAIFGQARPQQSSIFGEDIISDKSLDEVILSYLAEDLEEGSK
ncbi:MAG TPA: hypothetical protein VGH28_18635 [Polyangiaceae bacterium]